MMRRSAVVLVLVACILGFTAPAVATEGALQLGMSKAPDNNSFKTIEGELAVSLGLGIQQSVGTATRLGLFATGAFSASGDYKDFTPLVEVRQTFHRRIIGMLDVGYSTRSYGANAPVVGGGVGYDFHRISILAQGFGYIHSDDYLAGDWSARLILELPLPPPPVSSRPDR